MLVHVHAAPAMQRQQVAPNASQQKQHAQQLRAPQLLRTSAP